LAADGQVIKSFPSYPGLCVSNLGRQQKSDKDVLNCVGSE